MAPATQTGFLLSPARCDGRRAQILLRPEAEFPLAVRLREASAPLGEVFQFMSGLYFRGKLAYARAFGRTHRATDAALVIVPGLGLVPVDTPITHADLLNVAHVGVDHQLAAFRAPLERDARALAARMSGDDVVVLLGSISTVKYTAILIEALGPRLHFPAEFVGRGDMSRGGLMLRRAASGEVLSYAPVAGAVVRGPRPPKLEPLPRR